VKLKGVPNPLGLFTVDMKVDNLPPSKMKEEEDLIYYVKERREKKKIMLKYLTEYNFNSKEYLFTNKDLKLMME